MFGVARELGAGDRAIVDLVGPVGEAKRPDAGEAGRELEILRHAGAAMRLDRVVEDAQTPSPVPAP